MYDTDMMLERICDEMRKIAEKGLNTGNLETAYKLVDMYKDIKNTEYWETKSEYYGAVLSEMKSGEGYSERRKRDSRGRYSRDGGGGYSYEGDSSYRGNGRGYSRNDGYDRNNGGQYERFMDSKNSYRSSKSPDCKKRMMETLEEYMDDFSHQMEEMLRDSDCQEERDTIKRYINKIKSIA